MVVRIRIKDLDTGRTEVLEAAEKDSLEDVLIAMGLNPEAYEVADGLTGRHVSSKLKLGETPKRFFCIRKK